MGFFDSSSSSSSRSETIDQRVVADAGAQALSASGTAQITTLDGGVISNAFEFAKAEADYRNQNFRDLLNATQSVVAAGRDALDSATVASSGALKSAAEISSGALESARSSIAAAFSESKGEGSTKLIAYSVLAGVVLLVVMMGMRARA